MASNLNQSMTHGTSELLTPTTILQLDNPAADTQTPYTVGDTQTAYTAADTQTAYTVADTQTAYTVADTQTAYTDSVYHASSMRGVKRNYSEVNSGYQPNETPINYSVRAYGATNDAEEERKRVRRERNKLAAAKCRQKRTDLTNRLQEEVDTLDIQAMQLQETLRDLKREKEQLEFVLQAHRPMCLMEKVPLADTPVNLSTREIAARPSCLPVSRSSKPTELILPPKKSPSRAKHFPDAFKPVTRENDLNTPTESRPTFTSSHSRHGDLVTPVTESKSLLYTPVAEPRPVDLLSSAHRVESCASQLRRSTSDSGSDVRSPPNLISL